MLTSTAPVLPALSDYSLHPRHTWPTGPNAQCPTTQSWFSFRTAVSLYVPFHLGSFRLVFVHAGHLAVMATPQTKEQFIEKLTEYKYFRYAVIGSEIGAEGTPHFQGYLELTQQTSVKQKNDLLVGCHSDLRRVMTNMGRRTDIEDVKQMVYNERGMKHLSHFTESYRQLKFCEAFSRITAGS